MLLVALLALAGTAPAIGLGTGTAVAQPAPTPPPPNPSDGDLRRSGDAVNRRAGEVGALTTRLTDLDSRTDDLQAALAAQRETAEAAYVDLQDARDSAAAAERRAADARVQTEAAGVAIDEARSRLDDFLTATYQQGIDSGPLGLLTEATSPEDLVSRAEYTDAVVRSQAAAQDGLERARVGKANADSAARAALDEARAAEERAAAAKQTADHAFAVADAAAREQASQLAAVATERAQVQAQLDAAEAADSGLRAQRVRYDDWQRRLAEEQAARERAEREAATARVAAVTRSPRDVRPTATGGPASVQRVIDRATSQLGVQYVWGGGTGRGPTTGIPDAFGSPLNRVGFDCSGLMLYAYSGAGVSLPRVSSNQFNAGRKVPISDLRPGDMVFYKNGNGPIHHVAMYIGNGRMIEAPYTGANVRIAPLRTRGLLPQATRML